MQSGRSSEERLPKKEYSINNHMMVYDIKVHSNNSFPLAGCMTWIQPDKVAVVSKQEKYQVTLSLHEAHWLVCDHNKTRTQEIENAIGTALTWDSMDTCIACAICNCKNKVEEHLSSPIYAWEKILLTTRKFIWVCLLFMGQTRNMLINTYDIWWSILPQGWGQRAGIWVLTHSKRSSASLLSGCMNNNKWGRIKEIRSKLSQGNTVYIKLFEQRVFSSNCKHATKFEYRAHATSQYNSHVNRVLLLVIGLQGQCSIMSIWMKIVWLIYQKNP